MTHCDFLPALYSGNGQYPVSFFPYLTRIFHNFLLKSDVVKGPQIPKGPHQHKTMKRSHETHISVSASNWLVFGCFVLFE